MKKNIFIVELGEIDVVTSCHINFFPDTLDYVTDKIMKENKDSSIDFRCFGIKNDGDPSHNEVLIASFKDKLNLNLSKLEIENLKYDIFNKFNRFFDEYIEMELKRLSIDL